MRQESSRLRKAQELIEVEIGVGVDHAGDNAVIHRLFGVHPEVAIGILLHLLHRLAGCVSNHALRTALADNGKQQRIIRTIPKKGYVLEAKYCRPLVSGPPPDPRPVAPEVDIPIQETAPSAPELPAPIRQQTPVAAQPFSCINVLLIMLLVIFTVLCSGYLALTYNNKIVAKEVAKNIYSHLRIFALLAPGERMKEPTAIYDRLKESYTRLNRQAKQKALRIAIYYRSENQTLNYTFRIHNGCEQRVLVMQIDHWRSDTALLNKLIVSETRRKMDEMARCNSQ